MSAHIFAKHFSSEGDDAYFSLGIVGAKSFLTKIIYLRGDMRAYCTVMEADGSFISVNGDTMGQLQWLHPLAGPGQRRCWRYVLRALRLTGVALANA